MQLTDQSPTRAFVRHIWRNWHWGRAAFFCFAIHLSTTILYFSTVTMPPLAEVALAFGVIWAGTMFYPLLLLALARNSILLIQTYRGRW